MNLTVNGKPATVPGKEEISLSDLLVELQVDQPDYVSVELNGEFVEYHSQFPTTIVKDGDSLEFLYFMGGGR